MTLPCASVCEKPWYTTLTNSYVPIGCGDESVPLTTCRSKGYFSVPGLLH